MTQPANPRLTCGHKHRCACGTGLSMLTHSDPVANSNYGGCDRPCARCDYLDAQKDPAMTTPYQLHCGEALAFLATLPDASVDAVITDPPYSSGGMIRSDRTQDVHTKYVQSDKTDNAGASRNLEAFSGDSRDAYGYWFWCSVWLGECMRIVKPGGVAAIFTDWRQLGVSIAGIQSGGWVYRGVVPWHKPNARPTQSRWANSCEYVVWGSNGPRALDHLGAYALPGFFHATAPTSAIREHITQKPLEVMRELVKIAPKGGVVLDPFMGSGTTGVAALLEGRRFIGSEMTEHYFQVATERISTADQGYKDDGSQMVLGVEDGAA